MLFSTPDFIKCPYPGEMLPLERMTLYNAVRDNKARIILEIGCGEGASTYYMAEGQNSKWGGEIHTCDPTRSPTQKFLETYSNVFYIPRNGCVLIDCLIKENIIPDFVFFDGPEDPQVALDDFKTLDPYLLPGTVFAMHDWCTGPRGYDGAVSTKADLIKPYISGLNTWQWLDELYGDRYNVAEEYDSVGLAFYRKI